MKPLHFLVVAGLLSCTIALRETASAVDEPGPPALHVAGNHLEDTAGKVVRLQGVNIPSLDWSPGGEHFLESLEKALDVWHSNSIRIPLTQDLWFGYYQGNRNPDEGKAYRALVDQIIQKIATNKAYAVLDLHWSDGGQWGDHVGQHCMPDENSILFWKDVAARYANHPAVLFDLYNEPHDVSWDVWQNGGEVDEKNDDPTRGLHLMYRTPGMQALLDTVRAMGAKNVVVVGGLDWGYDLRGLLDGHALTDDKGNGILYATHIYPWKKERDARVAAVLEKYPVYVGEVGTKPWKPGEPAHENVYTPTWAPEVLAFIKQHQLSWAAWSFHPGASPCLIQDWNYTPTPYWGELVLQALTQP